MPESRGFFFAGIALDKMQRISPFFAINRAIQAFHSFSPAGCFLCFTPQKKALSLGCMVLSSLPSRRENRSRQKFLRAVAEHQGLLSGKEQAQHPHCEPDLTFKKPKPADSASQQWFI
jgi:hypothetical protein